MVRRRLRLEYTSAPNASGASARMPPRDCVRKINSVSANTPISASTRTGPFRSETSTPALAPSQSSVCAARSFGLA